MKTITIVAIVAAVAIVGAACIGIPLSGVLNSGTTGSGGDTPVQPTDTPVEPTQTPTVTPTPTPTSTQMSYFSGGGSKSDSGSGSSTSCEHTWTYSPIAGDKHSKVCSKCNTHAEDESCVFTFDVEDLTATCTACGYEKDIVASISEGTDTRYYFSVADAVNAAVSGNKEIKLLRDMSSPVTIKDGQKVIINSTRKHANFIYENISDIQIKYPLAENNLINATGKDGKNLVVTFETTPDANGLLVVYYAKSDTEMHICTVDGFDMFADLVNKGDDFAGKTISLFADIDLGNKEWTPIGTGTRSGSAYTGNTFKGTFDGGGNSITGLSITGTTYGEDYALGLFGVVDGGTVKNVNIHADINAPTSEMAGGAVGMLTGGGMVEDVTVYGKVNAKRGNGGIVGRMTVSGTINECTNNAEIYGTGDNVGGIVGAAYYNEKDKTMTISNCVNKGKVSGEAGVVGGIVGLSCADVSNCVNNVEVTGNGYSLGGIVGEQQNAGSVKNCVNNAGITATPTDNTKYGTGGIVGWVRYSGSTANYQVFEVIEVTGNINRGATIKGDNNAGGIVGTVYNDAVVKNNKNYATSITATTFAAGIVGNAQFPLVSDKDDKGIKNSTIVSDNLSTTGIDNIQVSTTNKDLYVYDNSVGTYTTIENNKESES